MREDYTVKELLLEAGQGGVAVRGPVCRFEFSVDSWILTVLSGLSSPFLASCEGEQGFCDGEQFGIKCWQ